MATRAQITVNGVAGSDDDVTLNGLVQLNNNGLGDESTYEWTIISQPSGLPAVLSNSTIQAPSFTANKEGSYLVQLIVNKDLADQRIDRVIVAVRELETRNRIPAAGETTENNAETGWANTAVDQILQRVTRFTDAGVLVGVAGEAGLIGLDVVYAADVTTIATGLPGQRDVPLWRKASAADQATVGGLLGVLLGGVDGAPAPASGALVRVGVLEIVKSVSLGTTGVAAGTPVYVTNAGTLSLTPGTIIRQVGTVLDDMGGGFYGIWFTGEGTFGTIQGVAVVPPLYVTPGTVPEVGLDYQPATLRVVADELDLTPTGVAPGTYGDAAPSYPDYPASRIASFSVDGYGRLTAASQAGLTIGGLEAKTYVDNGDAATLAAANTYTDQKSYGLSSKVPVHVATIVPLPANTANGSFQTLTANVHGPLGDIDGHTLLVGERILVKNEAAQVNNGIYVLTQAGSSSGPSQPWIMTRADDANSAAELCGSLVTVNVGTVNAGTAWLFAFNPSAFTFGTTPVIFTQFNAVPATASVLGTVQLQGALAGAGSLATAPVVALGTGYVSGVLPAANGGTGLAAPGAAGNVLTSNGTSWTSSAPVAAQAAVTGGVRLAGGLGGTGSTAEVPKLDMAHATSGTLSAAHGGTGLTTSGVATDNILVADGSGGWEVLNSYRAGSILDFPGATVLAPTGLRGRRFANATTGITADLVLVGQDSITPSALVGIQAGTRNSNADPLPASPPVFRIFGADGATTGGNILVVGGYGATTGGGASLFGGSGLFGGDTYVQGGGGTSGVGGDVFIRGGSSGGFQIGGAVSIRGGTGGTSGGTGGPVTIEGGQGTVSTGEKGGTVTIYGGAGFTAADAGDVVLKRRPGATAGNVIISEAFINGTGTTGQVLTSRGASTPPEWQDLGGAPGPAARGAYRATSIVSDILVGVDFCVAATNNVTLTLPDSSLVTAGCIFIASAQNSSGATLAPDASTQRIGAVTSISIPAWASIRVMRTTNTADNTAHWITI